MDLWKLPGGSAFLDVPYHETKGKVIDCLESLAAL